MEKEGLIRALDFLKQDGLSANVLVTDRHRQIAKFVRESHPEIKCTFQHLNDLSVHILMDTYQVYDILMFSMIMFTVY